MDRETPQHPLSSIDEIAKSVMDIGPKCLAKVDYCFRFQCGNRLVDKDQSAIETPGGVFLISRDTFHGSTSSFSVQSLSGDERLGVEFGYTGLGVRNRPYIEFYVDGEKIVSANIKVGDRDNWKFDHICPERNEPQFSRAIEFLRSVIDLIPCDNAWSTSLENESISRTTS